MGTYIKALEIDIADLERKVAFLRKTVADSKREADEAKTDAIYWRDHWNKVAIEGVIAAQEEQHNAEARADACEKKIKYLQDAAAKALADAEAQVADARADAEAQVADARANAKAQIAAVWAVAERQIADAHASSEAHIAKARTAIADARAIADVLAANEALVVTTDIRAAKQPAVITVKHIFDCVPYEDPTKCVNGTEYIIC